MIILTNVSPQNSVNCLSFAIKITSSSQASKWQRPCVIAAIVDHPKLIKRNYDGICAFLCDCEEYARKVKESAQQTASNMIYAANATKLAELKLCVDFEWLKFVTVVDFTFDL